MHIHEGHVSHVAYFNFEIIFDGCSLVRTSLSARGRLLAKQNSTDLVSTIQSRHV